MKLFCPTGKTAERCQANFLFTRKINIKSKLLVRSTPPPLCFPLPKLWEERTTSSWVTLRVTRARAREIANRASAAGQLKKGNFNTPLSRYRSSKVLRQPASNRAIFGWSLAATTMLSRFARKISLSTVYSITYIFLFVKYLSHSVNVNVNCARPIVYASKHIQKK